MSYKILLHPLAETEFSEAQNWYEERLSGLGVRFEEKVNFHLQIIMRTPLLFPTKRKNFREAKINTFPYVIVYKILEKRKTILILSFHHTSRNPKIKYER
jgi:mRNA-degrading endonuclease RelE of RelBE toxin-antitoxin system